VICVGAQVIWHGRPGVIQAIGFSRATHRTIATVAFSHREILRVPVDQLDELEEVK
jgi:hypothetical protein